MVEEAYSKVIKYRIVVDQSFACIGVAPPQLFTPQV